MTAAIRVENLGKCYQVSHQSQGMRYRTFRDSLVNLVKSPLRRFFGKSTESTTEDFWALKDVSFDMEPGEVVGIVGRNGAGKSTLLKILSRITKPTTGRVEINGRVGSLLEVGTGFHHELSGRENIYLNGSILGMSRKEIDRKFDEIVAFAGVERFLDTPVKRYSSGMYVRLAFAVAAHLEPEIMMVDEVLAVGDADFQQKCFEKMEQVARSGRTVFLVSHQLSAVRRLCRQAILLDKGELKMVGTQDEVIDRYLAESLSGPKADSWITIEERPRPQTTGQARFRSVKYSGGNQALLVPNGPLEVTLRIESIIEQSAPIFSLTISERYGTKLLEAKTSTQSQLLHLKQGMNTVSIRIHSLHLMPGIYKVGLMMKNNEDFFDRIPDAFQIEVLSNEQFESLGSADRGFVTCEFELIQNT